MFLLLTLHLSSDYHVIRSALDRVWTEVTPHSVTVGYMAQYEGVMCSRIKTQSVYDTEASKRCSGWKHTPKWSRLLHVNMRKVLLRCAHTQGKCWNLGLGGAHTLHSAHRTDMYTHSFLQAGEGVVALCSQTQSPCSTFHTYTLTPLPLFLSSKIYCHTLYDEKSIAQNTCTHTHTCQLSACPC